MISPLLTGIDLLITRGPDLDDVVRAVETIAGTDRAAIKFPDDADKKRVAILDHASRAAIDTYSGGDFAFKVALDGRGNIDYLDIAHKISKQLGVMVAWPDGRTLAATAFIGCEPDGFDYNLVCEDAEPDGLTFQRVTLPLTRGDLNGILSNVLWAQPHSAKQRYEIYDRSLNNELDFDLRAIDDAILDAVRELGARGARIMHANLHLDLRRFYPPILRTMLRRALGGNVSAPDLTFDDIAAAIWNAIPDDQKISMDHDFADD